MIDSRRLATFRAVARTGRISAAAKLVHLSQPAVTAQVHALEEACGRPLFVRSARGVTLTAAGRVLADYAERVARLLDEAAEAVGVASEQGGALHVAASTTIAALLLPRLVGDFTRETGPLEVRIDVANTDAIIAQVADGLVPLGLVEGLSRAPRVRLEPFVDDELVPMVATNAPPALLRLRRARDLASVPVIWREPGSGTRAVVERALKRAVGRRPPHARDVQIGATDGIKAAALAGMGVAFLSRWSVGSELMLGQLKVLALKDLRVPRRFSWALPPVEPSGVTGRFLRFARLAATGLRPPA